MLHAHIGWYYVVRKQLELWHSKSTCTYCMELTKLFLFPKLQFVCLWQSFLTVLVDIFIAASVCTQMPFTQSKPISTSVNVNVQHHRQMYVNRINEDYKEYKLFFLEVYVLTLKMKILIWWIYSKQRWVDCKQCEDNWYPCHH